MKIKSTDFRLGNLVKLTGEIVTLEIHMLLAMVVNDPDYEFDHIELSSDILLKAGFISDDNIVYELNGVQFGAIENGFLFLQEFRSNQFFVYQYLHQVQNLYFALTGTELHINI